MPALHKKPASYYDVPTEPESWLTRQIPWDVYDQFFNIPPFDEEKYFAVKESQIPAAVERLRTQAIVRISQEQASKFAGVQIGRPSKGESPYLVRGVIANDRGNHGIDLSGNYLWVSYNSIGPVNIQFHPFVIILKEGEYTVIVTETGSM